MREEGAEPDTLEPSPRYLGGKIRAITSWSLPSRTTNNSGHKEADPFGKDCLYTCFVLTHRLWKAQFVAPFAKKGVLNSNVFSAGPATFRPCDSHWSLPKKRQPQYRPQHSRALTIRTPTKRKQPHPSALRGGGSGLRSSDAVVRATWVVRGPAWGSRGFRRRSSLLSAFA